MDLQEFDRKMDTTSSRLGSIGNKLVLFVTLPVVLLFGLAYCAGVRL